MMLNSLVNIAEETSPVTQEQRNMLSSFIDATTRGSVGVMGMRCTGAKCPFISACPLATIGANLPLGKRCPVEAGMITNWVNKHLKSLGIENPDDPIHSFDMDMLYEIATQELIKWRCSVHLSDDPRLVSERQIAATQQGEPIFGDVINPVLDVMERAGKNIAKIREALVATREAQIKAGQVALDPTQKFAEQRKKAVEIVKQRSEKMKEAEFKVKE